jgi:hypothetical protein
MPTTVKAPRDRPHAISEHAADDRIVFPQTLSVCFFQRRLLPNPNAGNGCRDWGWDYSYLGDERDQLSWIV